MFGFLQMSAGIAGLAQYPLFQWYDAYAGSALHVRTYNYYKSFFLGKLGFTHECYKVSFQIVLCSQHRLIRDDTCRLN
ncbi:hypothetical protein DPMN_031678 [Dreissena polymorpha]|uniref:Uncharacterized protein n=1 Tax=Dreissena polymorpha TaxID=45954 RepID=A0A9D4RI90_DREPO|nr:hypothetical protein DPMN_031633 [Dreissena polymorpha]KAH3868528.1 hypothetical protein DPMN_031678 [Dreissena polymorpha]